MGNEESKTLIVETLGYLLVYPIVLNVSFCTYACLSQNLTHNKWLSSCEQGFTSVSLGGRGVRGRPEEDEAQVVADRLRLYGALRAEVSLWNGTRPQ